MDGRQSLVEHDQRAAVRRLAMQDEAELYERAAARFGALLREVGDRWDGPTPATEWTVHDLVNHVLNETLWVPPLLAGETIAQVGSRFDGDLLGDDPLARWDEAAEVTRAAIEQASPELTIPLSYGPSPVTDYIAEFTADVVIHGWDLARSIGADDTIEPALLEPVYRGSLANADGIRGSGMVKTDVEAPPDADDQTKLLAIWG